MSLRPRCGMFDNVRVAYPSEESCLGDPQTNSMADVIRAARQQLAKEINVLVEKLENLEADLTKLRAHHQLLGQDIEKHWEEISRAGEAATGQISSDAALQNVLDTVNGLMTCTTPEQVLQILTKKASRWGIRAATFDVRGSAAWGASADGFGPELTDRVFRSLVIPLNHDSPFRQVCETAGSVETNADSLRRYRKLLDNLKPAPTAPILLLPIRSGGTVSAIFYADPGEKSDTFPVIALTILSEFTGAQLDRLIALSGGLPEMEVERPSKHAAAIEADTASTDEPATVPKPVTEEPATVVSTEVSVEEASTIESPYPPVEVIPAIESPASAVEEPPRAHPMIESDPTPVEAVPAMIAAPPPAADRTMEEGAGSAPLRSPAGSDITPASDAEQRLRQRRQAFCQTSGIRNRALQQDQGGGRSHEQGLVPTLEVRHRAQPPNLRQAVW